MTEKVSIIVPVYNVETWLDECMESIVYQTYKNLEIILVNDGSTDNSGKLCDEWKKKDDRVVVVHKNNGGLSSARNAGLDVCTGEYIYFLDSDDYIDLDTINYMLKNMSEKQVDVVCCATNRVINGQVFERKDVQGEKLYSQKDLLDGFYYYKEGLCGSVWNKLYKAKLFEHLRFPEGLNSEDYYVLFNIYLNIDKMFYNDKCFYNYRVRENSICTTKTINEHSFDKMKISDIIREITEREIPERIADAEAHQILSKFLVYSNVIYTDRNNKDRGKWISELRKSRRNVLKNKKFETKLKLKYLGLAYCTRIYIKLLDRYYSKQ